MKTIHFLLLHPDIIVTNHTDNKYKVTKENLFHIEELRLKPAYFGS